MTYGARMMIQKRKELGLTQVELAKKLKSIKRSTIACIETNRIVPSVQTAKEIGNLLGFEWMLFFEEEVQ